MSRVLSALILLIVLCAACAPRQQESAPSVDAPLGEVTAPGLESSEGAAPPEEVSRPAIQEYFLWRAHGSGGPVYLFGTIHGGVEFGPVDALPTPLRNAMEEAALFVLELDLQDTPSMALLGYMMNPHEPLSQQLSPERWETLVAISPLPARELDVMRPWFAYTLVLMESLEDQDAAAVDQVIYNFARESDREMDFFETIEEQLQMMVKAITIRDLEEFLDDPDEARGFLAELVEVYRSGDEEAISAMIFDHPQYDNPEAMEILLRDRNHAWMESLPGYLERGDVFIAVGAAHLFGEDGLLELLRAQGVEVERVSTR